MEYNINDYVAVKLTDTGRAELKRQHDELREKFPSMDEYTPPKEDDEGWCKFQGWVLMNTFGHMTRMASAPPFETTIKVIESWTPIMRK
jgi:hypothetical protein